MKLAFQGLLHAISFVKLAWLFYVFSLFYWEKKQHKNTKILNLRQTWCKNKQLWYIILLHVTKIASSTFLSPGTGKWYTSHLIEFFAHLFIISTWLKHFIVLNVWISENATFPLVSDLPHLKDSYIQLAVTLWEQHGPNRATSSMPLEAASRSRAETEQAALHLLALLRNAVLKYRTIPSSLKIFIFGTNLSVKG